MAEQIQAIIELPENTEEKVEVASATDADILKALHNYANTIRKNGVPLLTAEQEVLLAKEIEAGLMASHVLGAYATNRLNKVVVRFGDPKAPRLLQGELEEIARQGEIAKARFIESNVRLVLFQVRQTLSWRTLPEQLDVEDLVGLGNLGLIRAVEKFDFTQGTKFSTYAMSWIKKFINDALDEAGPVRLTVNVQEKIRELGKAEKACNERGIHAPTDKEIAQELNKTSSSVAWLRALRERTAALYNEEDMTQGGGNYPSPFKTESDSDALLMRETLKATLFELLKPSYPKEGWETRHERVVKMVFAYFSLDNKNMVPRTMEDVAKIFATSRDEVNVVVGGAIRKLKRSEKALEQLQHLLIEQVT